MLLGLVKEVLATGPLAWVFVTMVVATLGSSLFAAGKSIRNWGRFPQAIAARLTLIPLGCFAGALWGAVLAQEPIAESLHLAVTSSDVSTKAALLSRGLSGMLYVGVLAHTLITVACWAVPIACTLPLLARGKDSNKASVGLLFVPIATLAATGLAASGVALQFSSQLIKTFAGAAFVESDQKSALLRRGVEDAVPILETAMAYFQEWALLSLVVGAIVGAVLARGGRVAGRRELVFSGAVLLMGVSTVVWQSRVAEALPTEADARAAWEATRPAP